MIHPDIRKIDPHRPDRDLVARAGRILLDGGLVVAPTETRYGLLGRIDRTETVDRIFRMKKRPPTMPTSVFVVSREEIGRLGETNRYSEKLADNFLPGPLTLILRDKSGYPPPIVVDGKIGLRLSSSEIIAALLETTRINLTATSANLSGQREPETISGIADSFGTKIDLYLDSGALKSLTSTVVDCSGGECRILRQGAVKAEAIGRSVTTGNG